MEAIMTYFWGFTNPWLHAPTYLTFPRSTRYLNHSHQQKLRWSFRETCDVDGKLKGQKRVSILGLLLLLTNLEKKSTFEDLNGIERSSGGWLAVPVIGTPWVSQWGLSYQELGRLPWPLTAVGTLHQHHSFWAWTYFFICTSWYHLRRFLLHPDSNQGGVPGVQKRKQANKKI